MINSLLLVYMFEILAGHPVNIQQAVGLSNPNFRTKKSSGLEMLIYEPFA